MEQQNLEQAVSLWKGHGLAAFVLNAEHWHLLPRLSLIQLIPALTDELLLFLFLAHLKGSVAPVNWVQTWNKYHQRNFLILLDPAYLPESSWADIFWRGQGSGRRRAYLDAVFHKIIKMPWHAEPAAQPNSMPEASTIVQEISPDEQWPLSLAAMDLIACPPFEIILEEFKLHFSNGIQPACAICYARTSSQGKALDRSSSFNRQKAEFFPGRQLRTIQGVPIVPLCLAYNPKGEVSYLPMHDGRRPYAKKVWDLLHNLDPLHELVRKCFHPLLGNAIQF